MLQNPIRYDCSATTAIATAIPIAAIAEITKITEKRSFMFFFNDKTKKEACDHFKKT